MSIFTSVSWRVTAVNIRGPAHRAQCGVLHKQGLISESSKVGTFLDPFTEEEKEAERLSKLPTGVKTRSLSL